MALALLLPADVVAALGLVVLALLAAKAHGRQVRLERELRGFDRVDFMAENDPWVEGLWRRDRRLYWPTFAGVLAASLLLVGARGAWWPGLLLAPGLALVAAFALAGLVSLRRFLLAPTSEARKDPAWRARALAGSALWWGLVGAGAAAWASLALA